MSWHVCIQCKQHVTFLGVSCTNRDLKQKLPQGSILGPCLFSVCACCPCEADINSGMTSGSVFSHCLFLFCLNDLSNTLISEVHFDVDNTVVYLSIVQHQESAILHQVLETLKKWEAKRNASPDIFQEVEPNNVSV